MKRVLESKDFMKPSLLLAIALALVVSGSSPAAPPHQGLISAPAAAKTTPGYYLSHVEELRAKGINQAYNPYVKKTDQRSLAQAAALTTGEFRLLAILVEFADHPASVTEPFFDSLIFGSSGATVSSYYNEISYGQLDLVTVHLPSSVGWVTAPNTYAYYVDGKNGVGDYPRNAQKLVEDLVDIIDAVVDFGQYDNDGDGFVDNLMVVHSGPGAEFSGSDDDIASGIISATLDSRVRIMNLSLGSLSSSSAIEDAVSQAAATKLVFSASGNGLGGYPEYPAATATPYRWVQ